MKNKLLHLFLPGLIKKPFKLEFPRLLYDTQVHEIVELPLDQPIKYQIRYLLRRFILILVQQVLELVLHKNLSFSELKETFLDVVLHPLLFEGQVVQDIFAVQVVQRTSFLRGGQVLSVYQLLVLLYELALDDSVGEARLPDFYRLEDPVVHELPGIKMIA